MDTKSIFKIKIIILCVIILDGCKGSLNKGSNKSSSVNTEMNTCITVICINDTNEYNKLNHIFQKDNLVKISGIEYLNILKRIKCSEITIEQECYLRNGWIKKEELEAIFEKTESKELCPKVMTYTDELKGDLIDRDSLFTPKSTLGREALRLINSYYLGYYPCDIVYDRTQIDSLLSK